MICGFLGVFWVGVLGDFGGSRVCFGWFRGILGFALCVVEKTLGVFGGVWLFHCMVGFECFVGVSVADFEVPGFLV